MTAQPLSGVDWATAPFGICSRCTKTNVPVATRFKVEPEQLEHTPDDLLFNVPLCPDCHPGWPFAPIKRLIGSLARTYDTDTELRYAASAAPPVRL